MAFVLGAKFLKRFSALGEELHLPREGVSPMATRWNRAGQLEQAKDRFQMQCRLSAAPYAP
jgi:hypothetical protein